MAGKTVVGKDRPNIAVEIDLAGRVRRPRPSGGNENSRDYGTAGHTPPYAARKQSKTGNHGMVASESNTRRRVSLNHLLAILASGHDRLAYHLPVKLFCWLCLLWLSALTPSLRAQTYDLLIRHGRIADGTGNPSFFADVAVNEGHVVAIGKIQGAAKTEIDATDLVVAPGFIDVHTHAEEIDESPLAENFVRMGVTTLVLGNCGSSALNIGRYFKRLEGSNVSPNVATLVGHGTVRGEAMGGSFMRPPTAEELDRMKSLVEDAMKDGAVGLSTGLIYLPGTFAKTEELVELARVAARHDGIYASHMRDEGHEIFEALNEVFRIARESGIRAEISHLKLSGKANWGQTAKVIAAIEQARDEGLDITQDQYLYTASSTGISQLVPEKYREAGKFKSNLADPEQKARMIADMKRNLKRGGREDYSYAVIASYQHDPSLNGLNIVEAAQKKRLAASLDDQIELILEIQSNGGASGVFHGISEEDLQAFLRHPNTMFASDSSVRKYQEGAPHPRGYGNNARVLARYVRELKLLRLEDAIRRMTSLPANTFRLKNRGLIREGSWADLVVFDPAKVQDQAKFNDPHHYATGFAWVLVNGVPVVKDDGHTGARPGKVLRHLSAQ
jgi:N-acyl-D-amino-acid deacylase